MELVFLTVASIMALAATLTLAVWRTLTRPISGEKFEDALAALTGTELETSDTTLTSGSPEEKTKKSWNSFWLDAVLKTGRNIDDKTGPGRAMLAVVAFSLFFGVFVFPAGAPGFVMPAIVLGVVYFWLIYEQGKRRAALERQLPLLLAGLRSQMSAGMTIQAALLSVADDLPAPLGDEMRQVKADVAVAVSLDQALGTLASRLNSRLLNFLVSSIGIALRSGSDLMPQLITIEEIVRQRARIQGKIKSALAMAQPTAYLAMAAPVLMGLFLFASDPQYPRYFFGEGLTLLLIASAAYVLGAYFIRSMIKKVERQS